MPGEPPWLQRVFDAVLVNGLVVGLLQLFVAGAAVALSFAFDVPLLLWAGVLIGVVLALPVLVAYYFADRRRHRHLETRTERLRARLGECRRSASTLPYVVVGGTYLDVQIDGVPTARLDAAEFTSLSGIKLRVGSSAYRVAKSLVEDHSVVPHFYTAVAKGDEGPFAEFLNTELGKSAWTDKSRIRQFADHDTPISVLLTRPEIDPHQTTIFTHSGALSQLRWRQIKHEINESVSDGGIVYIGSYFKTGLDEELDEFLTNVGNKVIVSVDHGRLSPYMEEELKAERLRSAYRQSLVDIYLCTYLELTQLYGEKYRSSAMMRKLHVRSIAMRRRLQLPCVTVVKDGRRAFVLHDRNVSEVQSDVPGREGVYSSSRFNAAFLHSFIRGDSGTLLVTAERAAQEGYRAGS